MTLSPFTLVRSRQKGGTLAPNSATEAVRNGSLLSAWPEESSDNVTDAKLEDRKTIGIWDLGAWVGGLPEIIKLLNGAQDTVLLFEAQAAFPSGITSEKKRVVRWSEEALHRKLKRSEKRELTDAIIDVEFFEFAKPVRKDLKVNYLIGLSPDAIAGEVEDNEGLVVHSDFYCSWDGRVSLVSTLGMRELAAKANRSFEFAIGFIITAVVFLQLNGSRLGFHEDNNCLMDYNYNREKIADRFAQPAVCDDCADKSKPEILEMAKLMLKKLEGYPRPGQAKQA